MENIKFETQTEDREQQLFDNVMDAVFNLAEKLNMRDEDDLTPAEQQLLEAMDAWCEEIDNEEGE